jgi:hypothetical protein
MEKDVPKIVKCIAVAVLVLLMAACSEPVRPPEEIVTERAQARWDAMVAGEFERAWEYYSPGFREKTEPALFDVQMSQRPIRWDSAEVIGVDCAEEARCEITARIGYTAVGAPGQLAGMQNERSAQETWIRLDDQWWYATPN